MVEKGINLKSNDFKNEIVNLINNCNLPAVIVKQTIFEIYNEVCIIFNNSVQKEKDEYNKKLNKNIDEGGKENGE